MAQKLWLGGKLKLMLDIMKVGYEVTDGIRMREMGRMVEKEDGVEDRPRLPALCNFDKLGQIVELSKP